jgi:FKBP-type peptidyl-prolyl cis-trans isomerase FkpA
MRLLIFLAAFGLSASLMTACKNGGASKGTPTEHGHTYINHTNKNGVKPQVGDKIYSHVSVFIADSMFNSTRTSGRQFEMVVPTPEEVPAGKPLSPLFDAMFLGTEGDSMTFYQTVDSTMAKNMEQLPERFRKEKFIRFEVVFVKVETAADKKKKEEEAMARFTGIQSKMTQMAADYKAGKLNSQLTTTASGLKVLIEEKGTGAPLKVGDKVETNYYGCLTDGKMFDNSFQRGEPLGFALGAGQMIKGFDEGTQLLNHGGKATFFLPPALGYGDQASGPIPANSELIFYVEVQ